jgi:hypothetical protein
MIKTEYVESTQLIRKEKMNNPIIGCMLPKANCKVYLSPEQFVDIVQQVR